MYWHFPQDDINMLKNSKLVLTISGACHVNSELQGKVMSSALSPVVSPAAASSHVAQHLATKGDQSWGPKAERDIAFVLPFYDFPVG